MNFHTITTLLACVVSALVFCGCKSTISYTLLRLEDGKKTPVLNEAHSRELLLSVDDTARSLCLFGRDNASKAFVIRTVSYDDGRVLHRRLVPSFSEWYWHNYAYDMGFRVSPTFRHIAYCDKASGALLVFNTNTGVSSVVSSNVFAEVVSPMLVIEWLSDDELLASGLTHDKGDAVLRFYRISTGSLEFERRVTGLLDCRSSLSPSRRYFAFFEEPPGGVACFGIVDLKERCQVAEIAPMRNSRGVSGRPLWRAGEKELVYLDDGRPVCYDLESHARRVLKDRPRRSLSSPIYCTDQKLFCTVDPRDGFPKRPPSIYVLDLATGEESEIGDPEILGEILIVGGGEAVIYGMGQ